MRIIVKSDIYAQLKPKKLPDLRELANSSDKFSYFQFKSYASNGYGYDFDLDVKEQVTYAAKILRFTNLEVFKILEKSVKIVENTEQYTEYLLNDTFGEQKFIINPPGTVRFYSQDLICFYNGKSWRKLDKPIVHV